MQILQCILPLFSLRFASFYPAYNLFPHFLRALCFRCRLAIIHISGSDLLNPHSNAILFATHATLAMEKMLRLLQVFGIQSRYFIHSSTSNFRTEASRTAAFQSRHPKHPIVFAPADHIDALFRSTMHF